MGVLGKDASALQFLTVARCVACFRVKLDRHHQPRWDSVVASSPMMTSGIGLPAMLLSPKLLAS
jgi:hypothetical protein